MMKHEKATGSFQRLIGDATPVLVDFFATWCAPCRMTAPALDTLKQRLGGALRIIKIDIDNPHNAALVARYGVRSVPTLMLFRQGELLWRESGARSADELERIVRDRTVVG